MDGTTTRRSPEDSGKGRCAHCSREPELNVHLLAFGSAVASASQQLGRHPALMVERQPGHNESEGHPLEAFKREECRFQAKIDSRNGCFGRIAACGSIRRAGCPRSVRFRAHRGHGRPGWRRMMSSYSLRSTAAASARLAFITVCGGDTPRRKSTQIHRSATHGSLPSTMCAWAVLGTPAAQNR